MNTLEHNGTPTMDAPHTTPRFDVPVETAGSSRKKLWPLALIAAVLIALAFVAGYIPRAHHRVTLAEETRELAIPSVIVVTPEPGKATPDLVLPAEVRAFTEAPIYARANGYIKRWLVDIGAQVKAGQLLAEIDTPELDQELSQSRAQLAQAQAALTLAKTTSDRWAELLKTASVSEQEAAEKKADLDLKSATVDAAKANVHRLEDLQSFTRVTAPFNGTITQRNTDVGQLVAVTGGRELFRLADTKTLRVFVRVPQSASRNVTEGLTASLMVPEQPGRIYTAKVVRNSGAMDAASRTLMTELEVDNSKGELLAGSYLQVRFNDLKQDAALTLPSNTLLFRSEGPQVGVVGSDGVVKLHNVALGRDFGRTLEILDGVKPGDHVILNPFDSLTSGATVRVASKANGEK